MKKLLGILLSLMIGSQAFASIAVSPTRLELNANKVKSNYATTAITIQGDPAKPMRFKAYTDYFYVREDGEFMDGVNQKGVPEDISKKIRFVPSEFIIPPGKTQKLRVNIANINTLPEGESRAVIYIEDVNQKEYNIDTGIHGIGAQLIVKTRVGVPVYVDKGNFTKKGEIENFKIVKEKGNTYADFQIKSTGNTKIRYEAKVQFIQGKKLLSEYYLEGNVVPAGKTQKIKEIIPAEKLKFAGETTARVTITYDDEKGRKQHVKQEAQINL